jgi:DNA-binding MarR family transcriptional regulator
MDKEYMILVNLSDDACVTQRELAKRIGISLGSINLLLKKMIREGLIKIEKIPPNRAVYMLTPQGMLEKINKTFNYIKIHYIYISRTKDVLRDFFNRTVKKEDFINVLLGNDEISQLVKSVIEDIDTGNINIVKKDDICKSKNNLLIVIDNDSYITFLSTGYRVINLLEKI